MYAEKIAAELGLRLPQVRAAIELLLEGNTIPFIARYRKEATGELDEVQLRDVRDRHEYLTELDERRAAILKSIDEQGKLTPELKA
ncbi:MAG TPA: Tex-like N-terminal domain-containing protein, partial [Longimicrobium sp.]|nr:Tex-like N-terminal domain-containing protein [Longimicrobium sp.]